MMLEEEREAKESVTITRQKAKELNQPPLPIKAPQPTSEVAALINSELHSDEEDEEYQPGEEELNSDDDNNMTSSDIDSQPRTPATPYTPYSQDGDDPGSRDCYTEDGLFKIPQSPDKWGISPVKLSLDEEIIARRTRSKVCLMETPIEHLESTFIPPDITTDMYDFDPDLDNEWLEFLSDFTKPMSKETVEVDDDEGDPEYVAADAVPIDKEELRDPKVSKKELNDLIQEFCDIVGLFDCDNEAIETLGKLQDTLEIPGGTAESSNSPSKSPIPEKSAAIAVPAELSQSVSFIPNIMSTPTSSQTNPVSLMLTPSQATKAQSNLITSEDIMQAPIIIANDFPLNSLVFHNGGVYQVAAVGSDTTDIYSVQMPPPPAPLPINNMTDDHKTEQIKSRAYVTMEKRYSYLNGLPPKEHNFPKDARGFVGDQFQILGQQMRQHVQLLAQNFIQTYGHPQFYTVADKFMTYLKELERHQDRSVTNRGWDTVWNIWNLKPAIELCKSWVIDLAADNKTNRRYLQFLNAEISRVTKARQRNTFIHCRLPLKLQHAFIESRVLMYPKLLPSVGYWIGFRSRKIGHQVIVSEGSVFAHELERTYAELEEELQDSKKAVSLFPVCQRMAKNLYNARNEDIIYAYVRQKRDKTAPMNPIKVIC